MQTSIERLEGDRVKLTVTLSPDEVDRAISAAYRHMASQVRIAGFRSGKAPRAVIDSHVGRERVLATALEELVEDSYPRALAAEHARPIEQPDVGTLDGLVPGEAYSFTAEFDSRPELTLTSTDGMSVVVPPAQASDEEVDAQIEYLRDRFASLEPVEDRGVEKGDFVLLSFVGTIDGEAYEGNTVDKYLYELGAGQMPDEFDAALIGTKAGDSVQAVFAIPDNSSVKEYVGKQARFEITVHEVKAKVLPELDDEFAGNAAGYESVQEMREDVRKKLDSNKEAGRIREMERGARRQLAERVQGDVPKRMVDSRASEMFEEFFRSLQQQELTLDQYVEAAGVDVEQIRHDIEEEAAFRVRDDLALEALFREKGMDISEEELAEEIGRIADSEKRELADVMEQLVTSGLLALVREDLMHRKAVRWLMENVEFVDEEPSSGKKSPRKKTPAAEAAEPKAAPKAKKAVRKPAAPRKPAEPAAGGEE